jgi:hypothetical protein
MREYPSFARFQEICQANGHVVDRAFQDVLDSNGDQIGYYLIRDSGAVLFHNTQLQHYKILPNQMESISDRRQVEPNLVVAVQDDKPLFATVFTPYSLEEARKAVKQRMDALELELSQLRTWRFLAGVSLKAWE